VSQPDILAVFTPQAPVEQSFAPEKPDPGGDDRFQRFLDDASHKVTPAAENNKPEIDRQGHRQDHRQDHSPSQKNSDKKSIEKPKPKEAQQTEQTNSKEIDQNNSQESLNKTQSTSKESETSSPQGLASVDNFQEAMAHLKELGFDVQAMETLLEIFNNDSGVDVGALLQSLIDQNSKFKDFSFQGVLPNNGLDENLFSQLENRKGLINDLLKQAGFTDQEAKNLIQKFESQEKNTSNLNEEINKQDSVTLDKTAKREVANQDIKNLVGIQTGDKKKEETTVKKSDIQNRLSPDRNKNQGDNGSKGDEKVSSVSDNVKVESKNIGQEKTTSQNTISMKYSDTNLDATKSKSLEGIKANGEVQLVNNNVASGANKTNLNIKTPLTENAIYKAPIETRVIDQIINRLSIRSNGSQSEVKIQLDPPSLGRIRMNIITSGDGVRTIIVAENQAVKQVIENNLSQLRDSMAGQGLRLDGFSVLVGGDGSPEFSQQNGHSDQPDLEFSEFLDPDEPGVETNEASIIPDSLKFYDFSQTVSFIA